MTEYLAPGVYVEETSFRAVPIQGVPTTTPGFRDRGLDREWKCVELRRYLLFLEHTVDRGTQWVVFEANDNHLWTDLREAIGSFLSEQWRQGFLAGPSENEAYFVSCDRSTMTQNDLDNGHVIALVGVALESPRYFHTFRLARPTAECPGLRSERLPDLRFELSIDGRALGRFAEVEGLGGEDQGTKRVTFTAGTTSFAPLRAWVLMAREGDHPAATVIKFGDVHEARTTWLLRGARPTKWVGPSFSAKGDDVAIEELELTYDAISITSKRSILATTAVLSQGIA